MATKINNIYMTSDWHLNHLKSIEFDQRPFRDLDHMHSVLINNYNSTVTETDTCYFLGDMFQGNKENARNIITQLNGKKLLVLGNHDDNRSSMLKMGFDVVLNGAMLWIAGELVTMTHCPLRGLPREDVTDMKGAKPGENWHGENRHKAFSIPNHGQFHLHGHIHSRPGKDKSQKILNRQYDIGVCANGFRPVNISAIESWIMKTKKSELEGK